jgi:hypothetical protein
MGSAPLCLEIVPPLGGIPDTCPNYHLREYHSSVQFSILVIAPPGIYVTHLTGLVGFGDNIVLCVHEILNFLNRNIVRYSDLAFSN